MNDRILKEACATPPPGGSKLTPYRDLIAALRKEGVSYRRIQKILAGEGLSVSYNAICQFVKVRRIGRPARKPMNELEPTTAPSPPPSPAPAKQDDTYARFEELKRRSREAANTPQPKLRFHYEEGTPLTLMPPTVTKCARPGCGHSSAQHRNDSYRTCPLCFCQGWMEPQKSAC